MYTLRLLDDEPIIIFTVTSPEAVEKIAQILQETVDLMQHLEHVYRIVDLSACGFTIKEVVATLNHATVKREGSVWDERITSVYVTGGNTMAQLLADGMNQLRHRGANVSVFTTLDEGLAYIRSCIKNESQSSSE